MARLRFGLVLWLLWSAAWAQGSPWPTRSPGEDAPAAVASAAPTNAKAAPTDAEAVPSAPGTVALPAEVTTPATVAPKAQAAAPLFLPDLQGAARYGLLALVLLAAYLLPALLYPTVLSATTLSPGGAAGLCVATGAVLIALPGGLAVLARSEFAAGVALPWYQQTANLPVAGAGAGALLFLAALAWRARGDA